MRAILEVKPLSRRWVLELGLTVHNNNHHKSMYVRLGKKSVTVSDRKPANYGVRRA